MTEEIALGSISTGAKNDLEKASDIARNMVCSSGMSKKLGPLTYGKRQQLQFLETKVSGYRNYSDETARIIDTEIMALVEEGEHAPGKSSPQTERRWKNWPTCYRKRSLTERN